MRLYTVNRDGTRPALHLKSGAFVKLNYQDFFLFSPPSPQREQENEKLRLTTATSYLQIRSTSALWLLSWKGAALGTGAEQEFLMTLPAACVRYKEKPRNSVGHKDAAPGLA